MTNSVSISFGNNVNKMSLSVYVIPPPIAFSSSSQEILSPCSPHP